MSEGTKRIKSENEKLMKWELKLMNGDAVKKKSEAEQLKSYNRRDTLQIVRLHEKWDSNSEMKEKET